MNGDGPGKFLTSAVTSGAGTIAMGAGKGALSAGLSGAWLGASIGSIIPGIGTVAGGAVGAGLGAAFGSLTGASKTLTGVWEKLISTTRSLVSTFAKFDPLISSQQERWRRLDMQIGKVWAKTLAPTLKHLTDIGIEVKQRWTRLKIAVFKNWEGVINKLITALGVLMRGVLSSAEFFEKLKNLVADLIKFALTPLTASLKLLWEGFEAFAKWLGIFTPEKKTDFAGGPSWKPGVVPGYGKSSAGGIGGAALLRGQFAPDMEMPKWAGEGKLEFTWVKDFKGWLGGYLDKILSVLGVPKQALGIAKRIAGPAIVAPPINIPGLNNLVSAIKTFMLGFKIGTAIQERKLGQPVTEEDKENYRREHNLPEKEKPTSFLGGSILPGVAGGVQRAIGMSAFAATPPESKVRIATSRKDRVRHERALRREKKEGEEGKEEEPEITEPEEPVRVPVGEPSGNIIMQILDSNQLLDMLAFSWDEVRTVLRQQQAEYTLLKYRMQAERTYL